MGSGSVAGAGEPPTQRFVRRFTTGLVLAATVVLVTLLPSPVVARTGAVSATGPPEPTPSGPLGGTCAPVDVALVLDTSTSMDSAIGKVKEQLIEFLDVVESTSGGDYRFGLIDFGRAVTVHVTFANRNRDAVAAAIPGLLQTSDNSGDPEAWDEALRTAVHTRAAAEVPEEDRRWHEGDFTVPWRAEANKLVVLVTDARAAGWDDSFDISDLDAAQATARDAAGADIRVSTIFVPNLRSEPDAASQLRNIAGLSGGSYAETLEDGDNLQIGLELAVRTCGADTDGDGLFDQWETDGIDHDGDGVIDVDLAAMGADPNHKDLFVQVSWMVSPDDGWCTSSGACIPSIAEFSPPSSEALRRVGDAFDAAPVTNPDGEPGIRLHLDAGSSTPREYAIGGEDMLGGPLPATEWADPLFSEPLPEGTSDGDTAAFLEAFEPGTELLERWVPEARRSAFTWALYVPEIEKDGGPVGVASGTPSDMFVVAGRDLRSVDIEAVTFMHEFGHTLGLGHGGPDDVHLKPNYLSIMNYAHAHRFGLVIGDQRNVLDYSRWDLAALSERDLDEPAGIIVTAGERPEGVEVIHYCAAEADRAPWPTRNAISNRPIDWNCDGDTNDIGFEQLIVPRTDIAVMMWGHSTVDAIPAWDDWANLSFSGGLRGGLASQPTRVADEDGLDAESFRSTPKPYAVEVEGGGQLAAPADAETLVVSATVTNVGEEPDIYTLDVEAPDPADATPLVEQLELEPGASAVTGARFDLPDETTVGDVVPVTLSVASADNPTVAAEATFTVSVTESVEAPAASGTLHIDPAEVQPGGTLTVSGTGFVPASPVVVATQPRVDDAQVVEASASGDIEAAIAVCTDAPSGELDVVAAGTGPALATGTASSSETPGEDIEEDGLAAPVTEGWLLTGSAEIVEPATPAAAPKRSHGVGTWPLLAVAGLAVAVFSVTGLAVRRGRRQTVKTERRT